MTIAAPQRENISVNRVYRRAEFADRPISWGSPLPSLEVVGDGKIYIYGSNLPRQVGTDLYVPPILDTELDITTKMTLLSTCPIGAGFHDACMFSVWIAFIHVPDSSISPPIIRDAWLIDWELDHRRRGICPN